MEPKLPTVCYVGITKPDFSRNKVYIGALRSRGVTVLECFDSSPSILKYWRLFQKHSKIQDYDVMIVGYPSAIAVPFMRLISRKPILFDAAWTMYEGIVLARGRHKKNPLARLFVWLIDRVAYMCADMVTLDTKEQLKFYKELMRVPEKKLRYLYTGCDEKAFYPEDVPKRTRFTAVFRGKYNIEAGLSHVLEAGRLLEKDGIDMLIYSPGYVPKEKIPDNVQIITEFFSLDELRRRMCECDVSIGQMEPHERLDHTIPHKAFESLVMEIPYIAARSRAMEELLTEGDSCLMVPAGDPEALRRAICELRDNPNLGLRIAKKGAEVYREKSSWAVLSEELLGYIGELQYPQKS